MMNNEQRRHPEEVLLIDGFAKWSVVRSYNPDYITLVWLPPRYNPCEPIAYREERVQYKIDKVRFRGRSYLVGHSEELCYDASELEAKIISSRLRPMIYS